MRKNSWMGRGDLVLAIPVADRQVSQVIYTRVYDGITFRNISQMWY